MITTVRHVLSELRPELLAFRWMILASVGAAVLVAAVDLVRPLLYRALFDRAILQANYGLVLELLVLMLGLTVLRSLMNSGENLVRALVGDRISQRYRQRLFDHAIHLRMTSLDNLDSGALVHRLTLECGRIGEVYISDGLLPVLAEILRFVVFSAVLVVLNWQVGLLALLTFPVVLVTTRPMLDKSSELDQRGSKLRGRGQSFLHEVLTGLRQVRASSAEESESRRWDSWLHEYWRIKSKMKVLHEFAIFSIYRLINGVGLSIVYGYGAWQVIAGHLTIGGLVAAASYTTLIYTSLQKILATRVDTEMAHTALQSVQEILTLPREWPDRGEIELPAVNGELTFENVTFHYPGTTNGIRSVSFTVEPSEFLGIVGPSGGGKSTIIDLCIRFYQPDAGRILVDGTDIARVPSRQLVEQVALVPQDLLLWNATVRENLLYGLRHPVSWDEIEEACRQTRVHDFVQSLPDRYETVVGPHGVKLSGGERQRIALARALLRHPAIFLLDEATSALDSITEAAITRMVMEAAGGKTRIVVAHRLSTVRSADRVLVIDGGEVVQEGPPSSLRDQPGLFRELYETQQLT